MPMGRCTSCDKLVTIVPKGLRFPETDSKQRHWHPVEHDRPDGKPCDGHKKAIE